MEKTSSNKEAKIYKNFIISISLIIVLSLSAIFFALAIQTRRLMNEENLIHARTLFSSIVMARKWNAHYGGVYVEKKAGIESNPYLKNPDIKSVDGKTYTKKNPALMTREISEYAEEEGLFKFHITSLYPFNPHNKPDVFEQEALQLFEKGKKEMFKTEQIKKRTYFRYMAPLFVEESCLQCHAEQGYKIGDIRGGISVTFDIEDIMQKLKTNYFYIIFSSIIIILSLLGMVYFFIWKLMRKLSEAHQVIEKMAITDGLTGIFNRGHLMSRFGEEFEKAKRLQRNLGCIMIDIDNFKSVNDSFGHLVGDEVLKEVSLVFKNAIRIYDILGRYGGEEFLIILPDTDFEDTKRFAERIRLTVKDKAIVNTNITISLGIANIQDKDKSIDDIIKRADEGLYKAKSSGRDRVEWITV
jgi:diguanylate cyclase (GGDEF)-like protein